MDTNTSRLVKGAAVAAIYAVLTMMLPAYTSFQFRISEIMTLLAYYNPFYILPLTLGCAISNIVSPFGIIDVIFGSLASFLATTAMSKTRNMYLASIWPAISSIIIGLEILMFSAEPINFLVVVGQIMISELIVVTIIGVPLMKKLMENKHFERLIMEV